MNYFEHRRIYLMAEELLLVFMGVQISDIVTAKNVDLAQLEGKIIATDAMNILYQFLSIIRQKDGEPLKDSRGRITSHLSGLFYRTSNLIEQGIQPIFVFDGEPPDLKIQTLESRRKVRAEAEKARISALKAGRESEAYKYAQRASRLTNEMINQAKTLLDSMGVAWIQAPGEGEAQAARIVQRGDAWATGSQDFDSLLFGSSLLVRNIAITGRRKLPGKDVYKRIAPELIDLENLIKKLKVNRRQLIAIGILVGTDYNSGIKGIGPKRALELIRKHGSLHKIAETEVGDKFEIDPSEVERIFFEPNVAENYKITWGDPDPDFIKEFLCERHDFSESRVYTGIKRLKKGASQRAQESLERWF